MDDASRADCGPVCSKDGMHSHPPAYQLVVQIMLNLMQIFDYPSVFGSRATAARRVNRIEPLNKAKCVAPAANVTFM